MKITTNGVASDFGNMNFTGCSSLTEVAKVIGNTFPDVEVSYDTASKKFNIVSKGFGADVTLTMADGTPAGSTSILDLLGTESDVVGTDSSGEKLSEAIARTKNAVAYCGIMDTLNVEDEVVLANANYVSGLNDYILLQMFHTTTAIDGACKSIKQMTQTKIRCLCYGRGSAEDSKVALGAYAGRAFSTNFSASNSSQTMNLKNIDECFTRLYNHRKLIC